jgi:hypothetical protein
MTYTFIGKLNVYYLLAFIPCLSIYAYDTVPARLHYKPNLMQTINLLQLSCLHLLFLQVLHRQW